MVALDPRSALRSLVGLSVGVREPRTTRLGPPTVAPYTSTVCHARIGPWAAPGCVLASLEPVHSFLGAFIPQLFFLHPLATQSQARWAHGGSGSEQDRLLRMLHDGVLGPIREDHMFQITACFHFSLKFYDTTVSNFRRKMGSKRLPVSRGAGTESPVRNLGGRSRGATWRRWHFSWASRCEQDWVIHRREQ